MIDLFATEPHFIHHLASVWHALPAALRGDFVTPRPVADVARGRDILPGHGDPSRPVLVASWGDYKRARAAGRTRIAYLEHGAGQSYDGDRPTVNHPGYSGGRGHAGDGLYLVPNEYSAAKWRAAYPRAVVEVVGCPKLESLPAREDRGDGVVVAVGFHWACGVSPESGSTFVHYRPALARLRERFTVIGHRHPRSWVAEPWVLQGFRRLDIPTVDDFADVCRLADVYICDNSSTLYEFAATGRPVIVLNGPAYRRHIHHGGRFWDWATVGLQVDRPADLVATVARALEDPPEVRAERERIVDLVYPVREDSARRAVDALAAWAGVLEVAA